MPGIELENLEQFISCSLHNHIIKHPGHTLETCLSIRWEALFSISAQLLVSTVQVAVASFSLSQLSSPWSLIYLLTILSHRCGQPQENCQVCSTPSQEEKNIFANADCHVRWFERDRCLISTADGLKNPPSPLQNSHPFPFLEEQKMCSFPLMCGSFAFILRVKLQHLEIHQGPGFISGQQLDEMAQLLNFKVSMSLS